MTLRGECLACAKLGVCRETSVDRVLQSYTCTLFEATLEPIYVARLTAMKMCGEENAVKAMMKLSVPTTEGDDNDV